MARSPLRQGSALKHGPHSCGPQKHRSCTDVLCLLLFLVFLAAWAAAAVFALKNGDPKRLTLPTDSFGHRCGEEVQENKTNLFFFDLKACLNAEALMSGCQTPQVCVSSCPQDVWIADIYLSGNVPFNLTDIQKYLICTSQEIALNVNNASKLQEVIDKKACASWYVPSYSFYFRCIPNLELNFTQIAQDYRSHYNFSSLPFSLDVLNRTAEAVKALDQFNQIAQNILHDMEASWRYLILFALAALAVSLVYIVLLRFLAGLVIWISIFALIILFATGAFLSFKNYSFLKDHPTGRLVPNSNSIEGKISQLLNKWEFWFLLLIICAIIVLLLVLIVFFLKDRIYVATALIKEGSKAVSSTISSLFFPVIQWTLQLACLLWTIAVFLFLFSSGTNAYKIEGMDSSCSCSGLYENIENNASCTVEEFNIYCHQSQDNSSHCYTAGCSIYALNSTNFVTYLQIFNVFGFLWSFWFINGLFQMILAGTFGTWYWTFHKRDTPFFIVTEAMFQTLWYHLGTVAFGSLILAVCSFIRVLIEFAERKVKKYDNALTKAIFCCCKCFFWCLQRFLCFVNRNAYIMCAIHGKNFCGSAKDAFQLLMRNVIRVVLVDKVTDFLFFLGKVLVTAALVVSSYYTFRGSIRLLDDSGKNVNLVYPWLPIAIVGIETYIITSMFFSVYSVAVDTLFLCFLEDCERNDGSEEKPYFMSKQLMKILGKKNQ